MIKLLELYGIKKKKYYINVVDIEVVLTDLRDIVARENVKD